jgi:hypothetical protein
MHLQNYLATYFIGQRYQFMDKMFLYVYVCTYIPTYNHDLDVYRRLCTIFRAGKNQFGIAWLDVDDSNSILMEFVLTAFSLIRVSAHMAGTRFYL